MPELDKLYQSDWAIGGNSNPDENEYMAKFDGVAYEMLIAAEEAFALMKVLKGQACHYTKHEVGFQRALELLHAVNEQFYKTDFGLERNGTCNETIFEFRALRGAHICYQHIVAGDCATTYFKVIDVRQKP